MLDLKPGVHLHEEEPVGIGDELDRAGADIAHRPRGRDGGRAHLARGVPAVMPGAGASSITFWWRRCDRAVALEQMHRVAMRVGEDLHLDVARPLQIAFDQHASSPNAEARFLRCADSSACVELRSAAWTTRMPLPPPPDDALISTG